jgi:glycosyltransferase involved in cell wall biosynthesis
MRIMLVTYRYGRDIAGGGERYLRQLMIRLAERGHHVEVFTTCSRQMLISPLGYLIWDNFMPGGREDDQGVAINRFEVRNPRPRRAYKMMHDLNTYQEKERESLEFASIIEEALRGIAEHCFLSGWHALESWEDGPARWTQREARLVVGGDSVTDIKFDAYSYTGGQLSVEISGKGSWEFELEKGKLRELTMSFAPGDSVVVNLLASKVVRPPEDIRAVGVAVRRATVLDGGRERELDLARGWVEFLETCPENAVGEVLWRAAEGRPRRLSRRHEYLMGPRSPRLQREVMAAAGGFDVIFGSMVPTSTMVLASRAAQAADVPFIAFPLFHTRDPNHYWLHFKESMAGAAGVEANNPVISDLMAGWGFNAFAVGPGYDLEEFSSPGIDGARFRRELGLGDRPILLWVARKNVYKGYREAIAALQVVRESGCPAALVMVGPDEDQLPVSGEGVYYLGAQPRETVLDAFDSCDVFLFPSLHESFCLVFCEAWLRGKPVLGNAHCAAARGLIDDREDGFLCSDPEDYGRRALELLNDPARAREMGERGRQKVLRTRGWDHQVEALERKLTELINR